MTVHLTLACGDYDRVWPLVDGRIQPEGLALNVIRLEPEECFWRMLNYAEFDVAEMSLASYWLTRSRGDARFVGIPVFLSRSFRHSSIYLPPSSDIRSPQELNGRRVGVPEYQMTAAVWVRGMLQTEYGTDLDSITWCTGGLEQPGRVERQPLHLPDRVKIEPIGSSHTLSAALLAGDIDALVAPRVPSVFRQRDTGVRRLFEDYAAREVDYYRRTGIFPIMHLVVVQAELLDRDPWIAESLNKAFRAAKQLALAGLADAPALRYTIPFLLDTLERQRQVFGTDPWPYGLEANRGTLDAFAGYLANQGLVSKPMDITALFAPSTLAEHRI